jgi:hypothetical protein
MAHPTCPGADQNGLTGRQTALDEQVLKKFGNLPIFTDKGKGADASKVLPVGAHHFSARRT